MGNTASKKQLRSRLVDDDPSLPLDRKVAIVGIGCRYANGIDDAQKFWKMLVEGMDCTSATPDDRFDTSYFVYPGGPNNKTRGKMYNQRGGYLHHDVYSFDRQFFKIPPDEAASLDPQVRLLLEVVFEGLEDAGMPPSDVRGTNTGVYIGITANEFTSLASHPADNISQYTNSGVNTCMASNRISYEFDFRGPSFSIDTACSSSLYAIHQASEAIRNGDCQMAVAGGVNLLLLPGTSAGFCQAGMLSPDGRCKSFDASADGYSRSEGAGVVILKPLQAAVDDGDQIYAVIRGGALTNDGRTPGIANPSYEAQVQLVEKAYRHANVDPRDVQYVEAHGTGTQVGDTTEANALGEAMGRMRPTEKKPLYIGSVKSNFGHSEGAAGVAGVIKVALCLKEKKIPPVVHFKEGNPKIDFKMNGIDIPDSCLNWPQTSKMLAGCSSFGFGGANAHIVFEAYTPPHYVDQNENRKPQQVSRRSTMETLQINQSQLPIMLVTSAATKEALEQRVSDWVDYLEHDTGSDVTTIANAAYTSALKIQHHSHRVAVVGRTKQDILTELRKRLEGKTSDNLIEGVARSSIQSHVVFVFSGMGTQWWGMSRQLMNSFLPFRDTIKKIDKILQKCGAKWSLVKLLTLESDRELVNKTEIAQPAICAIQIGLVELWRLCGVNPHAIVGHSVGEVAAAFTAGLLSLEDAVRVIYNRGRQLRHTSGSGTMLAVLHPIEEVKSKLENSSLQKKLDIAAVNSPSQIVLSGETEAVHKFSADLKADNIKSVVLKVNNAFHSFQQEAVKSRFLKKVKFLTESVEQTIHSPTIPMVSTVTNEIVSVKEARDPNYWYSNIRQQVNFMPAVEKLLDEGYTSFLEIGPHPALNPVMNEIFTASKSRHSKPFITHSMKRPRGISVMSDDLVDLMQSFGKLYVEGCQVDLESLFRHGQYMKCSVPSYPWQKVNCSCETESGRELYRFPLRHHVLLGEIQDMSHLVDCPISVWKSGISTVKLPWLKDHVVQGNVIVPAAAYVETALAATQELKPQEADTKLQNLWFERFLFAPTSASDTIVIETTVEEGEGDNAKLSLRSKDTNSGMWILHSTMELCLKSNEENDTSQAYLSVEKTKSRCNITLFKKEFFKLAVECGFTLGSSFYCNSEVYINDSAAEGVFYSEMSEEVQQESSRYIFHPAYLDSIFQAYAVQKYFLDKKAAKVAKVPFAPTFGVPRSIQELKLKGKAPRSVVFYTKLSKHGDEMFCDVTAANAETMEIFCYIRGFKFAELRSAPDELLLWYNTWEKVSSISVSGQYNPSLVTAESLQQRKYLVIEDKAGFSAALGTEMLGNGDEIKSISSESFLDSSWEEMFSDVCKSYAPTDIILAAPLGTKQDVECLVNLKTFEETQCIGGVMGVRIYNILNRITDGDYPTLWLISKSAQAVTDGEETLPAMTAVPAVGLTVIHENPEFPVYTIDMPLIPHNRDLIKSVFNVLKNPPLYENHVALRPCPEGGESFDIYSPRVLVKPQTLFHGTIQTKSWMLTDNKDSSWMIKRQANTQEESRSAGKVQVDVTCYMPIVDENKTDDGANSLKVFYCGRVRDGDAVLGTLQEGDMVMSVNTGNLTSTKSVDVNFLCKIPEPISASEALTATVHLLLPYVNMTGTSADGGSGLLIYQNDACDVEGAVLASLARSLGWSVKSLVLDPKGGDTISTSDYHTDSARSSPTNQFPDEYDTIIFTDGAVLKTSQIQDLCSSLRPMGTIIFQKNKMIDEKIRAALPPLANVVVTHVHTIVDNVVSSNFFQQKAKALFETLSSSDETHQLLKKLCSNVPLSELSTQRHNKVTGEIVTVDDEVFSVPLDFEDTDFHIDGNSSYIVTGGSRGFGAEIVEWLVRCGAKYVIIFSRNKHPEEEIQQKFAKLRSTGVRIEIMAVDVSSYDQIEKALTDIKLDDSIPQVEGIFHCAVVYADSLLQTVTADMWNRVMAVKAYGALVLHKLTVQMQFPIKYFVLLSSIVALLGNTGQASYCSSNAFLASLGQLRRSQGLPATVLYGGVINSTGFAAREGYVKLWEDKGLKSVSPSQLLKVLGTMLTADCPSLGLTSTYTKDKYFNKNKHLFIQHLRKGEGRFSVFKALFTMRDRYLYSQDDTLANRLRAEEPAKALAIIEEELCHSLKVMLGIDDDIARSASLFFLGVTSQKAPEFSSIIEERFDALILPVELLNDQVTIAVLSELVYRKVIGKGKGRPNIEMHGSEKQGPSLLVVKGSNESNVGQLILFPPNGGGLTFYQNWHEGLNKQGVQTVATQLPGWEGREKEQPIGHLRDLVRMLGEELKPMLEQGKASFYGHSMGGLIAFEVAHYLLEKYGLCPSHLFIGGWYAPSMPYPYPNDYNVPMSVLRTSTNVPLALKEYGAEFRFMEESVLNNPAVMARLLPCIQAGLDICRSYHNHKATQLPCSLTVFAGKKDDYVRPDMVDGWKREVVKTAKFKKVVVPGPHLFLATCTQTLIKEILNSIAKSVHEPKVDSQLNMKGSKSDRSVQVDFQ